MEKTILVKIITTNMKSKLTKLAALLLAAVMLAGVCACSATVSNPGIGKVGKAAVDGIARQPEAAGNIRTTVIIVAGMIEGASLLAVITCLLAIIR